MHGDKVTIQHCLDEGDLENVIIGLVRSEIEQQVDKRINFKKIRANISKAINDRNDIKILKNLIDDLTLGLQYELIGNQDIASGLTLYEKFTGSEDGNVPSQIVVNVHGRHTLIDYKNGVLRNILLFNKAVFQNLLDELNQPNIKNRNDLITLNNMLNEFNEEIFEKLSLVLVLKLIIFSLKKNLLILILILSKNLNLNYIPSKRILRIRVYPIY